MTMQLTSEAFEQDRPIPRKYSCDGSDVSPPLSWSGAPGATATFVLTCDDPDAPGGTFVHWLYYNIPAKAERLPEGVPNDPQPSPGGMQGKNSFGKVGYGGPCPPGGTHRYFFTLYALDIQLDVSPGLDKQELLNTIDGHVLGKAQLMGTYER